MYVDIYIYTCIYVCISHVYPIEYIRARLEPWHSWPFWGRDAGLPRTNTYWNLALRVSSSRIARMGGSITRGTPKWMVYKRKCYENGCFSPIYGNPHIFCLSWEQSMFQVVTPQFFIGASAAGRRSLRFTPAFKDQSEGNTPQWLDTWRSNRLKQLKDLETFGD